MSARGAVAAVALALLAVGVVLGLVPRSAGGVNCGSALRSSGAATVADLIGEGGGDVRARCEDARSAMRAPTLGLLVGGGVLMLGAAVTGQRKPSAVEEA